jgi:nicotinate-nucleotide pyrophosphorylase (carboxylating)
MQALDSKPVERIVSLALKEDMGDGDVTTNAIIPQGLKTQAVLVAEEKGVLCGLGIAEMVFKQLDPNLKFKPLIRDGDPLKPGQKLAEIKGNARALLTGERTVLNFLQRLSGIATTTRAFVDIAKPYGVKILDTRKTTPGLRILEKYAVRCGGGENHRMGLYSMALIKDNHIKLSGSVGKALEGVRGRGRIEIELEDPGQLKEALKHSPDIIMLDNMPPKEMKKAVKMIGGRARTEASGGITLSNLERVARTGVDSISVGSLTHSYKSLNIKMEVREKL